MLRRWKSHAKYTLDRKNTYNVIIILLILCIIGLFVIFFESVIVPAIIEMAEDQAETQVVMALDQSISECDELNNITYDDIIHITYDENSEPKSVSAYTVKLNKIRSELSVAMNKKLDVIQKTTVFIPLGTILGFRFLSGFGIRVPVDFVPYGTAYADFYSSFEGHDINRTIHRIYLTASASVNILVPFDISPLTVETEIPIAETILSGNVPESFINIDGLVKHEKQND